MSATATIAVPIAEAVNADQARALLKSGNFVTVTFTKRDGTLRVLNGRSGVAKGVTGAGLAYDPNKNGIVILYETNVKETDPTKRYRAIRLNSIVHFKAGGKFYTIAR